MFNVDLASVGFEPLTRGGAKGVKVKYLIDQRAGAESFFLRYYQVEKGGYTPLDQHVHEHEVFILQGKALVIGDDKEFEAKPGESIYVKSNEKHQFLNIGEEPLAFLCVRGGERIYQNAQTLVAEEKA